MFDISKLERSFQIIKNLIYTARITSRTANGVHKTVQHFAINNLRLRLENTKEKQIWITKNETNLYKLASHQSFSFFTFPVR